MGFSMLNLWNYQVHNFRDPAFRNRYYYNMSHFPVVGDFIRHQDSMNYWNDYFKNRPNAGGWAGVRYPSMMAGSGSVSRGVSTGYQYVSRNLYGLYDEHGYRSNPRYRDVMYG